MFYDILQSIPVHVTPYSYLFSLNIYFSSYYLLNLLNIIETKYLVYIFEISFTNF